MNLLLVAALDVMAESVEIIPTRATQARTVSWLSKGKWAFRLICAGLFLTTLAFCIPASRMQILAMAGQILVVQQSAAKADVIAVALDADGAGALEAADLVHRGVCPQVAVFEDPPSKVDLEFLRRGLPYEDRAADTTRQLHALKVQNVTEIPRNASGSEEEGDILPSWSEQHGYRTVILVTSSDHSRRLNRILRRSSRGYQIRVFIQPSPYSEFDPHSWWKSREGVRTEIVEFQKLALDLVRHPLS